jgi:hypothetical protein
MCSPRWLFLLPGCALILLGLVGYGIALPGLRIGGVGFDAHTLLFASLFILCGYQAVLFALFAKTFAVSEGFLPPDGRLKAFYRRVNLERGLALAGALGVVGAGLLIAAVNQWRLADFGQLSYGRTMRLVIPGAMLFAISFQTVLSSFLISMIGLSRR